MEKEMKPPRVEDLERVRWKGLSADSFWAWQIKGTNAEHHPTEPAVQWNSGDWAWKWWGAYHRLDGPAQYMDGQYRYWIHGKQFRKEEWERHPLRLEWLRNKAGEI